MLGRLAGSDTMPCRAPQILTVMTRGSACCATPGDDACVVGRHEALEDSFTWTGPIQPQAGAEQDLVAAGCSKPKWQWAPQHARSLRAGPVLVPMASPRGLSSRWKRSTTRPPPDGRGRRNTGRSKAWRCRPRVGTPSHQRGNQVSARAQSSRIWADDPDIVTPRSAAPNGGSARVIPDIRCYRQ
jgi:hypothetical protein